MPVSGARFDRNQSEIPPELYPHGQSPDLIGNVTLKE